MPRVESRAPRQDPEIILLCCPCIVVVCLVKLVMTAVSRIFGCLINLCRGSDSSLRDRASSGGSNRSPSEERFQPFPPSPPRSSALRQPILAASPTDRFCQGLREDVDGLRGLKDQWLQIQKQLNAVCPDWPYDSYKINTLFDVCVLSLDLPLSGIENGMAVARANGLSSLSDDTFSSYKAMLGKVFPPFATALRQSETKSLEISTDHPRETDPALYRQHQASTRELLERLLAIAVKCNANEFASTLRDDLAGLTSDGTPSSKAPLTSPSYPPPKRSNAPLPPPAVEPPAPSSSSSHLSQQLAQDVTELERLKNTWSQTQGQLIDACSEWPDTSLLMNSLFEGFKVSLEALLLSAKSSVDLASTLGQPSYSESIALSQEKNLAESFAPFAETLRSAQSRSLEISSDHPRTTHPDLYRQHQENTRKFLEFLLGIAVKYHAEDFEATLRNDLARLDG